MKIPVLLALLLLGVPALAQESATRAAVAPVETREVVAEGVAAIRFDRPDGPGAAVLAAKKAAQAQALRTAVEKALGIYVSGRTLTANYVLVRDEVTTRAEGFATLKDVLSEKVGAQEVRVTVRAIVSLRPLAKRLKALGLIRAWRVKVISDPGVPDAATSRGALALEKSLREAGFSVVPPKGSAELIVRFSPKLTRVHSTQLQTAAGTMTMFSIRSDVSLRAERAGTGEVLAALSASETEAHIAAATAAGLATESAVETLLAALIDDLILVPAALSQPVALTVGGLKSATQMGRLESALRGLGGVQAVTRHGFSGGRATWELDVFTEALPDLAADLERLESVRISVTDESRTRIVARLRP